MGNYSVISDIVQQSFLKHGERRVHREYAAITEISRGGQDLFTELVAPQALCAVPQAPLKNSKCPLGPKERLRSLSEQEQPISVFSVSSVVKKGGLSSYLIVFLESGAKVMKILQTNSFSPRKINKSTRKRASRLLLTRASAINFIIISQILLI